ncbi:MAG: LysR family transcriptional regulator [Pseudomonadota bacterium]
MPLNLTIKQLRYAEAAGRLGSIAAAAKEHNISQSSITAAIDAMEASLGFDMFIRQPAKGIILTPSGETALRMIADILRQHSYFETELEAIGGAPRGVVRIGCYVTVAPGLLPRVLSGFSLAYPEAQIDIFEGDMSALVDNLVNGHIDVACTYDVADDAGLEFQPLFTAPPYALVPSSDPLSKLSTISLEDLAERPLILLDLPHTREYFEGLFAERGITPRIPHTTKSSEMVRSMVAGELGVSILNIRHADDRGYKAIPLEGDLQTPVFGVQMMKNVRPPLLSRMFIQHLETLKEDGAFKDLVVQHG